MSELPASALTMRPQDGVHQRMCLQLENNNDFLKSSSSSTSSSSSPDSTCSLSSLDVDLPEGMMGRKAAASEDDSGIQSPDCRPDDNDNSVSVYLDANEEGWHSTPDGQGTDTSVQNQNPECDNVFTSAGVDGDGNQGRRGSGDSSATEAQLFTSEDEEGEDEEEDSFLSLRSTDVVLMEPEEVQMCSSSMTSSVLPVTESHQEIFQDSVEHPSEEVQMCSSNMMSSVDSVTELHQETSTMRPCVGPVSEGCQDSVDHPNKEGQICSITMGSSVSCMIEPNQKTFQDSVDCPIEEGQISNFAMSPSVGPETDLHQEASQMFNDDRCKSATERTDVGLGNELHQREEKIKSSNRSLDVESQSQELHTVENQIQTSAKRPNVDLVNEIHQEAVQTTIDLHTEKFPSQPPAEPVLNKTMPPSASQSPPPSPAIHHIKDHPCCPKRNISQITNDPSELSHTRSPTEPSKVKYTKVELKRFSRPNLKDIKPKVITRATSTPRQADNNYSQSAASCEKNSQTIRSRAGSRRGQGDDGFKKNRASSIQARTTTPVPIAISDHEAKPTWSPVGKKQSPEPQRSKGVTNGCHVQAESSKATESVEDERGSHEDEVVGKENSTDGDMDQNVSSDLRPPGVVARVPGRGCVSAGVRAAPLGGAAKMRVIDSSPGVCGSAPSCKGPLKAASSKLPVKSGNLPMSLSSSSVSSAASENKGAALVMKSEEPCIRPSSSSLGKSTSTKPPAGVRTRTNTPTKPNTAGQKAAAHVTQSKTTQNALHRGGAARPSRNSVTGCPSSRGPRGTRAVLTHTEEEDEKKNRAILQLRALVANGNRRLEALAVVVQHVFNEREEALKQKKEVSVQLKNVREELAQSAVCCERLEREKASVCAHLDAAVAALQQQHQAELTQLEERLQEFYSAEWDRVHQQYQEQADRCTALMRQQVEEVKSRQEALRSEQEVTHSQRIEEIRQGYESMLAELQKGHERDRLDLDNTFKSTEAALNERIVGLTEENEALSERLKETEEKRRELADKSQRDARVVYLEQELDSLRVVLDIKNTQLHQQDKKLMQMDKLIESNVKLEEFVSKLRQENEDYRARMDKHAELSRQLSTEQAMLQQTLQKESKANKRLSMENEELLWKLHNGLSPRNSASFPSSPVSPR